MTKILSTLPKPSALASPCSHLNSHLKLAPPRTFNLQSSFGQQRRHFSPTSACLFPKAISKGDTIPNTTFTYVPWTPELEGGKACGAPTKIQTHDEFKGKKVVIVSVPGAYTPTCHVNHIPPFIQKVNEFKAKGVDQIYVIAQNDPFVMSAWGNTSEAKDKVIFATDLNLEFSKEIDALADLSAVGFGLRTGRYALIADDLKVVDFAVETSPGVADVSSAETVLGKL
ncbi:Redoxin-domain-containing protein [Violaceomyces palustris]|uniref:Redoxin-domain-containing protein n=1 Tax=Violaceomyces palustris TaxID=1673888 RepID=A0ACD0NXW0_9BASI|nr:Redoxin-domain-containing protein [Violaceomyces palustris]